MQTSRLQGDFHGELHPTIFSAQCQCRIEVVQEDALVRDGVVVEGGTIDCSGIGGILSGTTSRTIGLCYDSRYVLGAEAFNRINNRSVLGDWHLHSAQLAAWEMGPVNRCRIWCRLTQIQNFDRELLVIEGVDLGWHIKFLFFEQLKSYIFALLIRIQSCLPLELPGLPFCNSRSNSWYQCKSRISQWWASCLAHFKYSITNSHILLEWKHSDLTATIIASTYPTPLHFRYIVDKMAR